VKISKDSLYLDCLSRCSYTIRSNQQVDKTGVVSQKKKTTKSRGSNTNWAAVCVHKPSGTIYAEIQMVCGGVCPATRHVVSCTNTSSTKRGKKKKLKKELMDMVLLISRDEESKRATRSNVYTSASQGGIYISHCFGWTKEKKKPRNRQSRQYIYLCIHQQIYIRNAERHQGRRGTSIVNATRQLCRRF
jgi:hypothetical protein